MGRQNKTMTSYFICPECHTVMPLPRFCGKQRKANHIKDIWCPRCREIKKFTEKKNLAIRNLAGEFI